MHALFEIKKNPVGRYYFVFKDGPVLNVVVSGTFGSRSELELCLSQVRDTAAFAGICTEIEAEPCFLIERRGQGYVFSLIGFDGKMLFVSEGFIDIQACKAAIRVFKEAAYDASLVDLVHVPS